MTTEPIISRVAGAPISWGVSQSPGWGHQLPAERVLAEMRELRLGATELGPTGYLGTDPQDVRARLESHNMRLVGGFLTVTLHLDPQVDLAPAAKAIATLAAGGSAVVVLAAQAASSTFNSKVSLTDREWAVLLGNLDRLRDVVEANGMVATLHPHAGTAIEDRESVLRLIDSSDVPLCLDTGHLLIGGMEPLELLEKAADRIAHVHLKDVNKAVAASVSAGALSYTSAVRAGLYTVLGEGDAQIAAVVGALESAGYRGWYVLEQDCAFDAEPEPGAGPIEAARRSIDHIVAIAESFA